MIEPNTKEEKAYANLLDEKLEMLSEAARSIFKEATREAHMYRLAHTAQPNDDEKALKRMRIAATFITQHDRETLAEIVKAGLLAASSIDPDDSTPVGYKVNRGDVHYYYEMSSFMVDEVLEEGAPEPIQHTGEGCVCEYSTRCPWGREIVRHNEVLEQDILTMQRMIMAIDDYYDEIYQRHDGTPGWDFINSHLGRAVGNIHVLPGLLPQDEEHQ